jgi:hypothetical protein
MCFVRLMISLTTRARRTVRDIRGVGTCDLLHEPCDDDPPIM